MLVLKEMLEYCAQLLPAVWHLDYRVYLMYSCPSLADSFYRCLSFYDEFVAPGEVGKEEENS